MKKQKTVLTTKKRNVLIHDPIEALIARMCDPTDPIYDKNVAEYYHQEENDNTEPR